MSDRVREKLGEFGFDQFEPRMPVKKYGARQGSAKLKSLAGSTTMPFTDTNALEVIERLPGWYGRYFHSPNMTFAYYDFKRGSSIHEHFHLQEEVYEVIEGELELRHRRREVADGRRNSDWYAE
jgi:hypothetical protein